MKLIKQIQDLSESNMSLLCYLADQTQPQTIKKIREGWLGNELWVVKHLYILEKRKLIEQRKDQCVEVPDRIKQKIQEMHDLGLHYFKFNTLQAGVFEIIPETKKEQKTKEELKKLHPKVRIHPLTLKALQRKRFITFDYRGYHLTPLGRKIKSIIAT